MKKEYSYRWNSPRTGEPVELSFTLSIEYFARTAIKCIWKTNVRGINFYRDTRDTFDGALLNPLTMVGHTNGKRAFLNITLPQEIYSDMEDHYREFEKMREDFFSLSGTYAYTVHTTADYGTNNGFNEFELSFGIGLIQSAPKCVKWELDIFKIKNNLDKQFIEYAQENYKPYPIDNGWKEEYKKTYLEMIEARTAPGKCEIPASLVVPELKREAINHIRTICGKKVDELKKALATIPEGGSHYTDAEARQWEINYNNINNDGGFGFVPHMIGKEEEIKLREELADCENWLKKLG